MPKIHSKMPKIPGICRGFSDLPLMPKEMPAYSRWPYLHQLELGHAHHKRHHVAAQVEIQSKV
jgi:hypothetical protein